MAIFQVVTGNGDITDIKADAFVVEDSSVLVNFFKDGKRVALVYTSPGTTIVNKDNLVEDKVTVVDDGFTDDIPF